MTDLVLIGAGNSMTLTTIEPGQSRDEFFAPLGDGQLDLIYGDGHQRLVRTLTGYVTINMHDHVSVDIDDELNSHVTNK